MHRTTGNKPRLNTEYVRSIYGAHDDPLEDLGLSHSYDMTNINKRNHNFDYSYIALSNHCDIRIEANTRLRKVAAG